MVQEARELASRIRQDAIRKESQDFQKGAGLLADFAQSLGKQGLLPQNLQVVSQEETPTKRKASRTESTAAAEINLDDEWQRQANRYVELGYHTELEMTPNSIWNHSPNLLPNQKHLKAGLILLF